MATAPCTTTHTTLTLCWCQMTPIHWYIRHGQGQQVVDVIRAYHASYPQMIYQPDVLGATPLDLATQVHNHQAVDTIRELDAINRRAVEQVTTRHVAAPIETQPRTLSRLVNTKRDRYSKDELAFEFKNHRVEGMPNNLNDYIKQRSWGCTCGSCTEGWMSPRMRFRIGSAAGFISDLMTDIHTPEFPKTGVHPKPDELYPDVPSKLHRHVTLGFWIGYTFVFEMLGILLMGTDLPLTEVAVLKLARTKVGTECFLEKGGRVLHALDAAMKMAWEQSSRCDGSFEEDIGDQNDEYNALRTCNNDLNFELVRDRLGLPPDVFNERREGKDGRSATLRDGLDPVVIKELLRVNY